MNPLLQSLQKSFSWNISLSHKIKVAALYLTFSQGNKYLSRLIASNGPGDRLGTDFGKQSGQSESGLHENVAESD